MVETATFRVAVLLAGLALLASCKAIETSEAENTEQLLAAAGFHMKAATTPEQLANLETLTQRKVVVHQQDGQPRYVETRYDEYQRLSTEQEIAAFNAQTAMDWEMWGPYPGWW